MKAQIESEAGTHAEQILHSPQQQRVRLVSPTRAFNEAQQYLASRTHQWNIYKHYLLSVLPLFSFYSHDLDSFSFSSKLLCCHSPPLLKRLN